MICLAEKPETPYGLYALTDENPDDFRKARALGESVLGKDVALSNSEVIGSVVEAGSWPHPFQAEDGETYDGAAVVGIVWKSKKLLPLARQAELVLDGDGLLLLGDRAGDLAEPVKKHRTTYRDELRAIWEL
jgi:hypothetical protein